MFSTPALQTPTCPCGGQWFCVLFTGNSGSFPPQPLGRNFVVRANFVGPKKAKNVDLKIVLQKITQLISRHSVRKTGYGDNVPAFSCTLNDDHLWRASVIKRSNSTWFCLGLTHTIKRNMPHSTPKIHLIVLKLRPIPPSAHGVSFTI